MKKFVYVISLLGLMLLLVACNQTKNMLEGNIYSVTSHSPTIELSEYKEPPNSSVNFRFDTNKKMKVIYMGEEHDAEYNFDEDLLSLTVIDKNDKEGKMFFKDVQQYEKNEDIVIAKLEESSVPSDHLAYHALSGFSIGEMVLLYKK